MEKLWQYCIDYLDELSLIEDDWDSFGGEVSPYSLNLARELITKLSESGFKEPPFISPIPDGSIQLDWAFGLSCIEVLIPAYDDEKICIRMYNVEDPDTDVSLTTNNQDALIKLLEGWSKEENAAADAEWDVLKSVLEDEERIGFQV